MDPSHRDAREVTIEDLDSGFLAGFGTAGRATACLMSDAEVTWSRARAPSRPRIGVAS